MRRAMCLFLLVLAGCGRDSEVSSSDDANGGSDGGGGGDTADATSDAGTDSGSDAAVDAPADAGIDAPIGPANGSTGCGKVAGIASGTWVKRSIDVNGTRDLWVWLPANYDPARAYPIIYQLHGCSSSPNRETNNVPVQNQVGANAITVRGRAAANCWDTATTGPDVPYFDAMLTDVENAFCVDTTRRFLTGYSSGAFMTHRMACLRGDKLRGVATIAGGQSGSNCTGNVAALLIHDLNDTTVNISHSEQARDNHLTRNGCTNPRSTTPIDPSPCVEYAGCAAGKRVVWCQTTGQNHSRQDAFAAPLFWSFISANF
ncbi:MAG: hypothetical protein SFX73_15100 [Kofleriaceae bacterium]|nr:hypothetical protein [Kofleriaceae bacterium]